MKHAIAIPLLVAAILFQPGCAIAGLAATVFRPPTKIKPQFIPEKKLTVVIVEDFQTRSPARAADCDKLGDYITQELHNNEVAPVVPYSKVYELRAANPSKFRKMSIVQIGKAVGADQVIYVNLIGLEVATVTGQQMSKGMIDTRVKVVSTSTAETLWPAASEEGYSQGLTTDLTTTGDGVNDANIRDALLQSSAAGLARLFYTYVVPE